MQIYKFKLNNYHTKIIPIFQFYKQITNTKHTYRQRVYTIKQVVKNYKKTATPFHLKKTTSTR